MFRTTKNRMNSDCICANESENFGDRERALKKVHVAAFFFLSICAQAQADDFFCTYALRDSYASGAFDYFQSTSSYSQSDSCYSARQYCEMSASRYPSSYCALHDSGSFGYVYTSSQMSCSSVDDRRETCSLDGRVENIRLTRQFSKSDCEGNWGYTSSFIWVKNGCRAQFAVDIVKYKALPPIPRPDRTIPDGPDVPTGPGNQNPGEETKAILCASSNGRYESCSAGGQILDFILDSQQSRSECIEGKSYGAGRDYIWVDKGCRGFFKVRVWNSR
jgi:hypothetical protein